MSAKRRGPKEKPAGEKKVAVRIWIKKKNLNAAKDAAKRIELMYA